MAKKSLLKPTLATILLILSLYALFYTSISPNYNLNSHILQTPKQPLQSLRIYMYPLPAKFTYGVIQSYEIARGSGKGFEDVTKLKYPGNQHAAEWHLIADLKNTTRSESYVVRVWNPEEADLFYVPFFSSLGLVANPNRGGDVVREGYSDEQTQEDLVLWLEEHVYWKRNNGRDRVFICQDPNALHKVIDRVKNSVLLVSDFGRLGPDQGSLTKDVILPYSHWINAYKGEIGVENRKWLIFFMGNRYRNEFQRCKWAELNFYGGRTRFYQTYNTGKYNFTEGDCPPYT